MADLDLNLYIGADVIKPVSVVRDLGVFLDSELSMRHHINTVARSWFFHLRRLKSVRRILGAEVTSGLVSAFVTTRFDYCNSVLAGLPQSSIDPLQRVQNAAASAKNCDKVGKEPDTKFQRSDTKCANCGGEHPASYRGCPKFKAAKKIVKIQATAPTRITYAEAARRQRDTKLEKAKTTMENQSVKTSHPEKARNLPPSSECMNVTTPAKNNNKSVEKNHQPPSSESDDKMPKKHEDTHRDCVNKKTFYHFIQTIGADSMGPAGLEPPQS